MAELSLTHHKGCVWVIAHINKDFIYRVDRDLENFGKKKNCGVDKPERLTAFIPTVKILRKQFKGRDIFENVPLLFNYGFFQIPNRNLEMDFLSRLKGGVPAIHSWVRGDIHESNSFAFAKPKELEVILTSHKKHSIYDKWDIDNLLPGSYVNLKGYPFEGIDAKIISVDKKKEKVKVELLGGPFAKKTEVAFDNILYTVYHGIFDENDFKEASLEEMAYRHKGSTDKYMRDE